MQHNYTINMEIDNLPAIYNNTEAGSISLGYPVGFEEVSPRYY
jgi:hypothetical protein